MVILTDLRQGILIGLNVRNCEKQSLNVFWLRCRDSSDYNCTLQCRPNDITVLYNQRMHMERDVQCPIGRQDRFFFYLLKAGRIQLCLVDDFDGNLSRESKGGKKKNNFLLKPLLTTQHRNLHAYRLATQ